MLLSNRYDEECRFSFILEIKEVVIVCPLEK